MTTATTTYGARSRQPVWHHGRRVPCLYSRTLADGSLVYDACFNTTTGKVRRALAAATPTDAVVELTALRADFARGERYHTGSGATTVNALAADWLASLNTRVGHRDPSKAVKLSTVELNEQRLRLHILPALGQIPVADLTVRDIRRLNEKLSGKLAPGTIHSIDSIISGLLRHGVREGVVERNVARDLDREDRPGCKRESEPRYIDLGQIKLLLDHMGDRPKRPRNQFRPIVACCAYSALRISEALGLRWQDIDFHASTITISGQLGRHGELVAAKTPSSEATLPMLPALAAELLALRSAQASRNLMLVQSDALVFVTANGKPQSRRNVLRALQAAADAAGLNSDGVEPLGLHDLRHSFVACALQAGLTIAEVSLLARHANAKVTAEIYAGVTESARETLGDRLVLAGFGS